ncbi:hypothetical protein AZF06_22470 [Priestia endophytica]|nr:hypothetical protein AZF06_22470 [Priestia endophytica]MBG9813307.1 hypothetical protein [Priestia endophytica]
MTGTNLVSHINNNILAILWILLFLKSKKENSLRAGHIILLIFSFIILSNSIYKTFIMLTGFL